MPRIASRMQRIAGSATVELNRLVARRRQEGADLVAFNVGEPDHPTPEHVRQAAKDALDAGHTHYVPGPGIPELRQAVAGHHHSHNGIPCGPEHVLVTPTKHAVLLSLMATAESGDEVLVPDPGWVSYAPMTHWAGATPVPVPLDGQEAFRMTPDAVAQRITPRSRVLLLNSPSNPTGGINTRDDVRGLVDLAVDHDLWILSDEIYQHILYEGTHVSPASLEGGFDRTITVDGLSKSHAMTGWRVGWLVAPRPLWNEVNRLQGHSVTHCTSFAQYGAVAALTGPQDDLDAMRTGFRERRDRMVAALRSLPGVSCPMPAGAFYAFPRFEDHPDDKALAERLVEEAGVAATPGSAFGEHGRGHLRFSYATSVEHIDEGLGRVKRFLERAA